MQPAGFDVSDAIWSPCMLALIWYRFATLQLETKEVEALIGYSFSTVV